MSTKTAHPYIELRPGYRGGRAIITGTNFPVSTVVSYILHQGMMPEELVRSFSRLTLAQIYDALSYYYDHQTEIDAEIEKNLSRDAFSSQLPQREILRLRYDPATGSFVVQSLGKLVAVPRVMNQIRLYLDEDVNPCRLMCK